MISFKNKKRIGNNSCVLLLCLFFTLLKPQYTHAESYTLSVGQSVTISQTPYAGGLISNVGLAATLDPHLSFSKNSVCDAVITVKSYFDYTATVKLVFLEKYQTYYNNRHHTQIATYYKDVTISCKYQKPDPSKKPTKVTLPERVKVPISDKVYIYPVLEPNGAKATSVHWGYSEYSGAFLLRGIENETSCLVNGRAIGMGKAWVTIDDNESLTASTIIEVVDPNNPTPDNIFLPDTVEISVGGKYTFSPIMVPEGTSVGLSWRSADQLVAIIKAGVVTGLKEGETKITATSINELSDTCIVKVVKQDGRDDESDTPTLMGVIDGYEYVDLGLSVLWATRDVGAMNPEEEGGKYAWSETSEKESYTEENYIGNSTKASIDIKGTNQDVAHVKWGSNWSIPKPADFIELYSQCTFEDGRYNDAYGCQVYGNNGANIFFIGYNYWSSEGFYSPLLGAKFASISTDSKKRQMGTNLPRFRGMYVRAVSSADPTSSGKKPTNISLESSIKLKVNETFIPTYSITPSDATTTLKWYSDNPQIASVSPFGVITALSVGTTRIWIETGNGLSAYSDVVVENVSRVIQAFTNSFLGFTSFVVDADNKLWGFGYNYCGILKESKINSVFPITKVMGDVVSVAVGGSTLSSSYVVKGDGSLLTCGSNLYRQLGDGTKETRYIYKKVMDEVLSVSAGGNNKAYCVKKDGSLWTIDNSKKVMDDVKQVSAGNGHVLIVKKDGSLWGFGSNSVGQLGIGNKENQSSYIKIMDDVLSVSAGSNHSLVIKSDNTLWGFGRNANGQLGDGTKEDRITPIKITDNVVNVSGGGAHSLIVKKDGSLWSCGDNSYGQLGDGTNTERLIPSKIMNDVASVSAGYIHSLIVKKDNSLWACGANGNGQLGNGNREDCFSPIKIIDGGIDPSTEIIEQKVTTTQKGYAPIFDLQGRRVMKPQRPGIYISNGKKIVIK